MLARKALKSGLVDESGPDGGMLARPAAWLRRPMPRRKTRLATAPRRASRSLRRRAMETCALARHWEKTSANSGASEGLDVVGSRLQHGNQDRLAPSARRSRKLEAEIVGRNLMRSFSCAGSKKRLAKQLSSRRTK